MYAHIPHNQIIGGCGPFGYNPHQDLPIPLAYLWIPFVELYIFYLIDTSAVNVIYHIVVAIGAASMTYLPVYMSDRFVKMGNGMLWGHHNVLHEKRCVKRTPLRKYCISNKFVKMEPYNPIGFQYIET